MQYGPLAEVVRECQNWESGRFAGEDIRVGISAETMKMGNEAVAGCREDASKTLIRDVASVLFSFLFGLRES